MTKMLRAVGAIVVLFFGATNATAGGSSTHSADDYLPDNPWFLDDQPIEYCIETGKSLLERGQKETELKEKLSGIVHEAIENWRQFFERHGLDRQHYQVFPNKTPKLNLDFRYLGHDRSCSSLADQITFLFGSAEDFEDHAALTETKANLEFKMGVAARYHRADSSPIFHRYDYDTYRNGGVIWVDGLLLRLDRARTLHMVMHELGHVFGMPHNSTFVMDQRVGEYVSEYDAVPYSLGQVESSRWQFALNVSESFDLYATSQCELKGGKMMRGKTAVDENHAQTLNRLLLGFSEPFRCLGVRVTLESTQDLLVQFATEFGNKEFRFHASEVLKPVPLGPSLYDFQMTKPRELFSHRAHLFLDEFMNGYFFEGTDPKEKAAVILSVRETHGVQGQSSESKFSREAGLARAHNGPELKVLRFAPDGEAAWTTFR